MRAQYFDMSTLTSVFSSNTPEATSVTVFPTSVELVYPEGEVEAVCRKTITEASCSKTQK